MQAWHKEQKQKSIKKGKAATLKTRTEKLSKRDPGRLTRQVDQLRVLVESGDARPHDKRELERLETELKAVERAREKMGLDSGIGKRKRGEEQAERRERLKGARTGGSVEEQEEGVGGGDSDSEDSDVADIPLPPGPLPPLPGQEQQRPVVKTTYESAPILRDLRKEAAAFVPLAVKKRMDAAKAAEAEQEQEQEEEEAEERTMKVKTMRANAAPEVDLEEVERRFRAEVEEVEDDGR